MRRVVGGRQGIAATLPGIVGSLEFDMAEREPIRTSANGASARRRNARSSRRFRRHFLPIPQAGARSRQLVRERCAAWGIASVSEDAQLVVTELVSNAVEHAGTPLDVIVTLSDDTLHVAVHDGDPTPPRPQPVGQGRSRGRGLRLIEAVAASWGSVLADTGKVVWATLRIGSGRSVESCHGAAKG